MLDIGDLQVSVFPSSGLILFLFFFLFAHLRAGYSDLVPEVLSEIDALAAEAIAFSILPCDGVLTGFIAFLQAARDGYTLSAFRFRLIFLCCPSK